MSRMIDADALEELFREIISGIAKRPDMNGNMEHMIRASAMVIEMIKDAPTIEPETKWIPCSERLPEETEARYWVCTDGGYQCQCRWTNDVFGLGEGDTWTWKIFDIPQYSKVIAWMPLPEPYVERKTDE